MKRGDPIGPYRIVDKLGEGGMGEVYRARDPKLDRDVALKILPSAFASDADRLMRFEREAKTLAALNHPHIAQIHGLEEAGSTRALVMELVEGEDLAARIARGPLPPDEALPIARQIAEALEVAHDAGIIHRDLKPANVRVRPDGTVKVLDFGLAKQSLSAVALSGATADAPGATVTSPAVTMHGVILGTAAYMAPEQAKGRPLDRRADIWAFGCVLYEMLTGRRAFEGEDVADTIAAVVTKEPGWSCLPASTPPSIERLVRRCLQKQTAQRLPHIGVARLELAEALVGEPPLRPPPAAHRGRDLAAGGAAGAAAIAIAAALFWPSTPTVPAPPPIHVAVPMPSPTAASNGVLLSPDGRFLATRGPSGASMLHALDGSPSLSLDGIAGCWSPDSRSLALLRANNELVRLDVAGGPAVTLTTTSRTGAGCNWGRDGALLVEGGAGLFSSLTVATGTLTAVDADDNADGTERYAPKFLPDGRRFLYWAIARDGQRTVRAGSIDAPETRHIVMSDAPAIYSAGFLLFQRGATLVAQRFDERALTLSGEPQAITTAAAPGGVPQIAAFDASESGTLVFATTNGGVRAAQNWVNRNGNLEGVLPQVDGAELLNLAVSPDGTQVAGTRMDPATGNWDLWLVDLETGVPTRITRQPGIDADPVWSPDGRRLAYLSRRADVHGLYRLSLADGSEQLLLKIDDQAAQVANETRPTDWTPDGRFLIYESGYDILALSLTTSADPIRIAATPAVEKNGQVSPDGRWIAYQSADPVEYYVYVQPFPGPGAAVRVSTGTAAHPQWRSDGKELYWMGPSTGSFPMDRLFAANLTLDGRTVRSSGAKALLPAHVRLSALSDNRPHYAVAPDGQRFLLRQADGLPGPAVKMILNWPALLRRD
jgi:dipeptidyl aminopeptidase/acylaminoacyl peptidase